MELSLAAAICCSSMADNSSRDGASRGAAAKSREDDEGASDWPRSSCGQANENLGINMIMLR